MKRLALFLSVLKSGALTKTTSVISKYNSLVIKTCLILEELGYISGFTILDNEYLKVKLRFYKNTSVIRSISLFSKQSLRVYLKVLPLKTKNSSSQIFKYSFTVVSTSKFPLFLTDFECVILNCGGEPVFVVS